VRALDQLTASALPGTENASSPFFSPDNEWIGFFADGKLKKISVTGGTVITLCDAPLGRGGTWSGDGSIVFAPSNLPKSALARVSAAGGTATPITSLASDEISQRWPQMLPDDSGVLYTSNVSDNWNDARIVVQPLPNGTPKIVQPGFYGRYVPSGHLLFVKNATVFAAPFDLKRFEVTGPAVRALDGVVADSSTGGAQFAVSQTGTAAFLQGTGYSPMVPTVWMDRAGNTLPLQSSRLDWSNPQVSPDGKRLAVDISDGKQIDVWVQDLETANLSRLTFDSADDYKPTWTPDGRRIAFTSKRDGAPNLYWQRADGGGDVQRLTRSPNEQVGASWHPSGRFMAFHEVRPQTGNDVMILSLAGDGVGLNAGTPTVFAGTPFNESEPVFSPDGRWLAYHGNEAKRTEIFVRPFPKGDGKWQISSGGGRDAAWSRARSELLFFNFVQNRIFVAPYTIAGDSLNAETARAWSTGPVGRPARPARTFAVHPDGERVVIVPVEKQKPDHVTLAFNFFDELRQIAPVKK
jgi:serine/threonine-protein kinase